VCLPNLYSFLMGFRKPSWRRVDVITRRKQLAIIRQDLGDCRRCGLCEKRKNIVFGRGNPEASVMFVGEGPGADEDEQGFPFVGRAGKLLDKIVAAMGFDRDDVYIGNIVKCRPTTEDGMNRPPAPEEVGKCYPFLVRQIAAVSPQVVVALGGPAAKTILGTDEGITRLRGRWQKREFMGEALRCDVVVMPTFHPAFLLRSPEAKPYVARDMRKVLRYLKGRGIEPPGKSKLLLARSSP
jgi:uracil-DNA glycosylase